MPGKSAIENRYWSACCNLTPHPGHRWISCAPRLRPQPVEGRGRTLPRACLRKRAWVWHSKGCNTQGMRTNALVSPNRTPAGFGRRALFWSRKIVGLALLGLGLEPVEAQLKVGQTVPNFTLQTRRTWTNYAGRVFYCETPLRLSDFAGSIVFFDFFDPTCSSCQDAAS